ncbi:MAG: hypothetical protein E7656_00755 [Ruminococcaceae bacterium]|nr:hypothetical protein [Oscillospiraceae bacterium]
MKKKILSLLLAAFCVAGSFSACGPQNAGDGEGFNYEIDETKFNVIDADGTSKYTIVRAENAPGSVLNACMNLKNTILDVTGVELEVKSDFEKAGHPEFQRQDHEILIGHTNREETDSAAKIVERARDFVILQEGTRLAILAKSDAYVEDAVNYFIENYVDAETCSVAVDPGHSETISFDYPIDSFKINGVDIADYTIQYTDPIYDSYVNDIKSYVHNNYGYDVDSARTVKVGTQNLITIVPDAEKYPQYYEDLEYTESRITVEGSNIIYSFGPFADPTAPFSALVAKYFDPATVPENADVEITIEAGSAIADDKGILFDDEELLAEIDRKAQKRRDYIENTPNMFTTLPEGSTNKIIYISNDGSDSNNGLSPEEPIATISKLNIIGLNHGDVVLFRRGDEFRGKVKESAGVTYSSYGDGPKPVINGSKRNFADPALWTETDVKNVYKCSYALENVGNIVFDYSGEIGNYDELVGQLRVSGAGGFTGYADLTKDLEFYSNLSNNNLYLYSAEGNPGSRFKSIEIAESGNMFQGSKKDVVVDNLTIIFGGSHGVGTGTVENRTVQNCIFAWIGGSILKGYNGANVTRYGNAVEVYGGCNGYYVYDNWIYQIYDTGITHQYSTNDKIIKMENIEYRGNLVELCHWSIEYYNRGEMPGSCLNNVHVHDNMTLYGAYGWGSVGREGGAALHNSFQIIDEVNNYLVEDNIFAYSKGSIVRYNQGGDRKINFRNNTYVQYYERALGYMFGKTEPFTGSAVTQLRVVMREEDPIICFLMTDPEKEAEEAEQEA